MLSLAYSPKNSFLNEFKNKYSEEIDIILNIARIHLNKDKSINIISNNFTLVENTITLDLYIIGYRSQQNLTIPNDIIKILKSIELSIQTDDTIDRFDSHTVIAFNLDLIKKYEEELILLKTYLKLLDLYTDIINYSRIV